MCLNRITKSFPPNDDCEVWYKIVKRSNEWYQSHKPNVFFSLYRSFCIKLGWAYTVRRNWKLTCTKSYETYAEGFHFYSKGAAYKALSEEGDTILECVVWDIRAKGTDYYGKACVAKSFRAMREIKPRWSV